MRPILFGAAFKMLQFEPEITADFTISSAQKKAVPVIAPSIGASFHYGPDYKSDSDNRGPSFFAAGPIAGVHAGFGIKDKTGKLKKYAGIKPFFAILSSRNNGTGIVAGAALEYGMKF
jgi:hypothetical protein